MRSSLFFLAALTAVVGCENFSVGSVEAPLIGGDVITHQVDTPQPDVSPPPGSVDNDGDGVLNDVDCDDHDSNAKLPLVWFQDNDGDGWGSDVTSNSCFQPKSYVGQSGDCDDGNKNVHSGQPEVCNGSDDDCNGQTDDSASKQWFHDGDGDGHGDPTVPFKDGCNGASFLSAVGDDCNDKDASIHPSGKEVCNGLDDDCNSDVDDNAADALTFYKDADNDGYGRTANSVSVKACAMPQGYAIKLGDCADENKHVHPGQPEVCNDVDDDCNGQIDDGVLITFYADEDKDGYGNPSITQQSCAPVGKYIADATDCDDQKSVSHPDAPEICDGADNDCDGLMDEDMLVKFYRDADGDKCGKATDGNFDDIVIGCKMPDGYITGDEMLCDFNVGDCDDNNATVFGGTGEICDGLDNDCNGQIDDQAPDAKLLCDDGDPFTTEACDSELATCQYTDVTVKFVCQLPDEFIGIADNTCGVDVWLQGNSDQVNLIAKTSEYTMKASELCAALKAGDTLHVNSFMLVDGDPFVDCLGGLYVTVLDSTNNTKVNGTPGYVTYCNPGVDFVYTFDDMAVCQ